MQKSILIPTDFQVESLNTLKLALSRNNGTPVHVVLMYSNQLSNSITQLLFYSPEKMISSLVSPEFEEAVTILKNRFGRTIISLRTELFHGHNYQAFKNFIEAHGIDEIYIPKSYSLRTKKNSIDPTRFIKKTKLPVYEMEWNKNANISEGNKLSTLFNNQPHKIA